MEIFKTKENGTYFPYKEHPNHSIVAAAAADVVYRFPYYSHSNWASISSLKLFVDLIDHFSLVIHVLIIVIHLFPSIMFANLFQVLEFFPLKIPIHSIDFYSIHNPLIVVGDHNLLSLHFFHYDYQSPVWISVAFDIGPILDRLEMAKKNDKENFL